MPPGTVAAPVNEWDPQEQHLVSYGERRAEHLFHVILGPKAETPVDDIEPPAKVRTVIKLVEPEVILAVYRKVLEFEQNQSPAKKGEKRTILRDAKTRTRLMVRASTGRRPSEIMRAEPDDVDLSNRVWRCATGRAAGQKGYLNDDMLIAWMTFEQADGWGKFNTGSMAEVLRRRGAAVSPPAHARDDDQRAGRQPGRHRRVAGPPEHPDLPGPSMRRLSTAGCAGSRTPSRSAVRAECCR